MEQSHGRQTALSADLHCIVVCNRHCLSSGGPHAPRPRGRASDDTRSSWLAAIGKVAHVLT